MKHRSRDIKIVTKNREEIIPVVSNKAIAKEIKSAVSSYMIFVKEKELDSSFNDKEFKQFAFLERYKDCFSKSLLGQLPPKRLEDHHIELVPGKELPNRPLIESM